MWCICTKGSIVGPESGEEKASAEDEKQEIAENRTSRTAEK
jgi:hypothetical protein